MTVQPDPGVAVSVAGGADVPCSFHSLDSSVRLRHPHLNTLPPRVSVFGDILLCTGVESKSRLMTSRLRRSGRPTRRRRPAVHHKGFLSLQLNELIGISDLFESNAFS